MPCCDRNGCDRLFRGRLVDLDRRAFETSGLNRRQRLLLGDPLASGAGGASGRPKSGIRRAATAAAAAPTGDAAAPGTLLDIGAGIGALAIAFLGRGGGQATIVDLSRDSLAAARELAAAHGVRDRLEVRYEDALHADLEPADVVTLDRVICCDPQGPELLARAAALSRRTLAFSYPSTAGWFRWLAIGRRLLNDAMRLFGMRYRFYLHDEEAVMAAATSHGHRPIHDERVGLMRVLRLEREGTPSAG